ncbi:MAG TPA: type II secretion system protein, partial [Acidimicrobiales bacterium]|nr:type II secretion system protein [Acidimicrobiales bacterium]
MARQSSERGDTLVEVLLALIILGVAGVALLAGFATAISSSAEHRNLASLDSSERVATNAAIADVQQQAGQSNDPFSCPDNFTPSFSNLTGHFQVTVNSVNYWNGSGWQSGCVAGAAQQYTLTISNASAGWSTTETT